MNSTNSRPLQFMLPAQMHRELRLSAVLSNKSVAAVLREVISEHLQSHQQEHAAERQRP